MSPNAHTPDRRTGPRLAAVVRKDRVDPVLAALREEGVYDTDRCIREHDAETVEIPIVTPPESTEVLDVVPGAPTHRSRGLRSRLRRRGFDEATIDDAPTSWDVIGDVVIANFDGLSQNRVEPVARILAEMHGASTVVHRLDIAGEHRIPEIEVIVGGPTMTEHVEDGIRYALDTNAVMFSTGNQDERRRMGRVVDAGEAVLDLFAGIGYFTLPMASGGALVRAVERNPRAYEFLLDNVGRNEVRTRVSPVCGDCRHIVTDDRWPRRMADGSITPETLERPDRIVMGHFDAPDYLDVAMDVVADGGVVHLHALSGRAPRLEATIDREVEAAERPVRTRERRRVKSYAAGIDHVVIDIHL